SPPAPGQVRPVRPHTPDVAEGRRPVGDHEPRADRAAETRQADAGCSRTFRGARLDRRLAELLRPLRLEVTAYGFAVARHGSAHDGGSRIGDLRMVRVEISARGTTRPCLKTNA